MKTNIVYIAGLVSLALFLPVMRAFAATNSAEQTPTPSYSRFDERAREGQSLNVIFFGASLTWGANASDPQRSSYRAQIARLLIHRYPKAHFAFWDGSIGGPGSILGAFRLSRDVLSHKPDLVFLDFSANDGNGTADATAMSSYESLLRRMILQGQCPVVQVFFPFKWDITAPADKLAGRDARVQLARVYHTGAGDAIALIQSMIAAHQTTLNDVWPIDGVHPGDFGYSLFCKAAWDAYLTAVRNNVTCVVPRPWVYADTFANPVRVRISQIGPLPQGWRVGIASRTSPFFDSLMSRWLDDESIAEASGASQLAVAFRGSFVMLFGESSMTSGKFTVAIDHGVPVEYDAGSFGRAVRGNAHYEPVLATGLDPNIEHTLVITPELDADTAHELRIESVCVAGGPNPQVTQVHVLAGR